MINNATVIPFGAVKDASIEEWAFSALQARKHKIIFAGIDYTFHDKAYHNANPRDKREVGR